MRFFEVEGGSKVTPYFIFFRRDCLKMRGKGKGCNKSAEIDLVKAALPREQR